jgi:GMP synthase (glutamine-hydrolysing)
MFVVWKLLAYTSSLSSINNRKTFEVQRVSNTFETIVILDFGSQYTQLIARRIRELGVYCEIHPYNLSPEVLKQRRPKGIILSGGPSSVYETDAPHCSSQVLDLGVPVLGICYGLQLISYFLGGRVEPSPRREYGAARIQVTSPSPLLANVPADFPVWMSHGDHVTVAPPGFDVIAASDNSLGAVVQPAKSLYGIQFHPEVAHTPDGSQILSNFVKGICG